MKAVWRDFGEKPKYINAESSLILVQGLKGDLKGNVYANNLF